MGCECYQIGGPWIAEDPNCPAHGRGGLQEQLDDAESRLQAVTAERDALQAELVQLRKDVAEDQIVIHTVDCEWCDCGASEEDLYEEES